MKLHEFLWFTSSAERECTLAKVMKIAKQFDYFTSGAERECNESAHQRMKTIKQHAMPLLVLSCKSSKTVALLTFSLPLIKEDVTEDPLKI